MQGINIGILASRSGNILFEIPGLKLAPDIYNIQHEGKKVLNLAEKNNCSHRDQSTGHRLEQVFSLPPSPLALTATVP